MRAPVRPTTSGYRRRPPTRFRPKLVDAFANELRIGDEISSAVLPGPERVPSRLVGHAGVVVELGRVRVGVRYPDVERVEHLDPRALIVVGAVDARHLLGPDSTRR